MHTKILPPLFYLIFISASVAQINPPNGVNCSGIKTSFIYTQDFEFNSSTEMGSKGWVGVKDWAQSNPPSKITPQNGFWGAANYQRNTTSDPANAQSGSKYVKFEGRGANNQRALISPAIDLSDVDEDLELTFWLHAFGADIGQMTVSVSNSVSGPFNDVWTYNQGSYKTEWEQIGINLKNEIDFNWNNLFLKFDYTAGSGNDANIALDNLRLETCGYVCSSGQVTFLNETNSSVNFNWSTSGTQSNIQYSVSSPDATSQEGTIIDLANAANQTVNLSDLEKLTTYALWVRAECTSGYSDWEKFLFTTTEQYNYIISPGQVVSIDYCYSNNDGVVYTFQSDNGEPVELNFLEGQLYKSSFTNTNRDKLIIKDGNSNVLEDGMGVPVLSSDRLNVAGLRFLSDEVSSSDAISFEIDNFANFTSCSRGDFDSIVVEATIKACDNKPEANYTTFKNCTDVSEAFFINVNIASFGDANALNIKNNIDGTVVSANQSDANYNYEIGPFSHNTNVKVTIEDAANSACFISSSSLVITSCPPENDDIENAILVESKPLDDYSGDVVGTFYEATASENTIPSVSCNNGAYADDDVWFKFKPSYEIQYIEFQRANGNWFDGNSNTQGIPSQTPLEASLYKHEDGQPLSEIQQVFCYQNYAQFGVERPRLMTPVLDTSDNITYYLRVYTLGQTKHNTQFDLAITGGEELGKFVVENAEVVNFCDVSTDGYSFTAPSYTGYINHLRPQNVSCEIEWFPNPSFMAFEVTKSGDIDLKIEQFGNGQFQDFELLIYGPYQSIDEIYNQDIYAASPIKCDDGNSNYNVSINNAEANELYLIVGLNLSGVAQEYRVTQTNGSNNEGEIGGEPVVEFTSDPLVLDCVNTTITLEPDWTVSKNIVRYEWYNSDAQIIGTEKELSVSEPGNYALLVYNNCDVSDSATVEVLVNEPELNADVTTSDICGASGEATFVITGTNTAEVTYAIGNGADQTVTLGQDPTVIVVQITEDTTLVLKEITDGLCTETLTVSAEAKLIPYTDLTPITLDAICEGSPFPLPATVDGYTGVWSPVYDATQTTVYTFTPDEVSGSCINSLDVTVSVLSYTDLTPITLDAVCGGDSSPLPATVDGYTGVWTPAYDATQTTVYTFTPDDVFGLCLNALEVTVEVWDNVTPTFDAIDAVCEGLSSPLNDTSLEGYVGVWTPSYDATQTQTYTFTANAQTGICFEQTTLTVIVDEKVAPTFDLDFSEPVCVNTSLDAFPTISKEGIRGVWTPELDSSMAGDVTYYFTPEDAACAIETYVTVSYVKCEVPEGFSPNGDAYNQYFDLSTFGVKRLEVYNRYGKLVYSKNNYKKEWFGQDAGNGALPTGTYFYIITFNDNSKPKTGSIYINR